MCIYCTSSFYVWSIAAAEHQIGYSHLTNLHFACIWQHSSRRITFSVHILLQSYIFILPFQLCALYRLHKERQMFGFLGFPHFQDSQGWVMVPPLLKTLIMWGWKKVIVSVYFIHTVEGKIMSPPVQMLFFFILFIRERNFSQYLQ